MSLVELPSETIIRILSCLKMVCRRFRDLVASDSYLQYVLELELCGYTPPSSPRLDLKYLEKLEALREHRRKWEDLGSIQPTLIQFSVAAQSSSGEFVDGVYARGLELFNPLDHTANTTTYAIEFYRLPSSNTEPGLKQWTHTHLGEGIIKFAIQPTQDLLVLVQLNLQEANQYNPVNRATYTIHLRTITANEPHPAVLGNAELEFEIQTKRPNFFTWRNLPDKTLFIHISGLFLGIVFCSTSSEVRTHLVVWNWVSGRRVAHLSIQADSHRSPRFAFLSDGYFIVPRSSGYVNVVTGAIVKNQGASNYLDVYCLPSPGDESGSQEAYHITSFAVPAPKQEHCTSSLALFGPSVLVPSKCLYASPSPRPALYDLAPNQSLLSIYDEPNFWAADSVGSTYPNGALYFSAQLLLAHLACVARPNPVQDCHVTIPWRDWGERTSWVDMDTKLLGAHAFSQEQRLLVLSGHLAPTIHLGLCPISILSFGGQKPSARKIGGYERGVHVHVPPDCPIMDEGMSMANGDVDGRKVSENEQTSQFLSGKTKARRTYLRTDANLQLPDYRRLGSHRAPLVGNEHVVVQVTLTGSDAGTGILVYSL